MELWFNFAIVGLAAFILFLICALYEKRSSDALRFLLIGIPTGMVLGSLSDFVLWGTYSYPLGYGLFYLTLNAAVIYGCFVATVLLLQRVRLVRFSIWIIAMASVYETTNHFFPVWSYQVTPLLGWISFVLVGNFATALFIVLIAHIVFKYRFQLIADLSKK
jgi:hypothetical protein